MTLFLDLLEDIRTLIHRNQPLPALVPGLLGADFACPPSYQPQGEANEVIS